MCLFLLCLLDSLFCGKATAVVTVHRTVAFKWVRVLNKKEQIPKGICSFCF